MLNQLSRLPSWGSASSCQHTICLLSLYVMPYKMNPLSNKKCNWWWTGEFFVRDPHKQRMRKQHRLQKSITLALEKPFLAQALLETACWILLIHTRSWELPAWAAARHTWLNLPPLALSSPKWLPDSCGAIWCRLVHEIKPWTTTKFPFLCSSYTTRLAV